MKYDIAHGIRSLATGLFVVGLIFLPFAFFGPIETGRLESYYTALLALVAIAIVSQIFVVRYRSERNTSDSRKRSEKIYSVIGVGLIVLFFLVLPGVVFLLSKLK